jgi:glycosyltransferase involved in cell wall biosynthesis
MENIDWVIVPSIWYENSPLVIQEAFMHKRPVICSDIGGMAEKVIDGVTGLHFRASSSDDLARTVLRAATSPGLWESLRAQLPDVFTIEQSVRAHAELYEKALSRRRRALAANA